MIPQGNDVSINCFPRGPFSMAFQVAYIFQYHIFWTMDLNNFTDIIEQGPPSIGKPILKACLTKGLAWKSGTQHIKGGNLGNI